MKQFFYCHFRRRLCGAEGTLAIKFSIADGVQTSAVQAVANLNRRLMPDNIRSRRNVDTTSQLLTFRHDNWTVTPTGIYNWTGAFSTLSDAYIKRRNHHTNGHKHVKKYKLLFKIRLDYCQFYFAVRLPLNSYRKLYGL